MGPAHFIWNMDSVVSKCPLSLVDTIATRQLTDTATRQSDKRRQRHLANRSHRGALSEIKFGLTVIAEVKLASLTKYNQSVILYLTLLCF